MSPRRRTTLRDIAESLDLSVNTVSRALADKDAVGVETRRRVKAEAERLGYVPNTMARSLVLQNAMTLGLVITNPSNPFYARLISAIEERGRTRGYSLMLMVTEDSVDNERRAAEELMRWGVDGVLAIPVQHGAEHWERLRKSGVPLVLLNRDLPGLDVDLVGVDYYAGARAATEHALSTGATELYLVEEDLDISPVAERIRGFRDTLAAHGLGAPDDAVVRVDSPEDVSVSIPFDPGPAYGLGASLARRAGPGAVVLAGNDYHALGLCRAFSEQGLRVGVDVGVIGHGDHPFSAYLDPALTTVRLPAPEVGRAGIDRLLEHVETAAGSGGSDGAVTGPTHTLLPPELVVRASVPGTAGGEH
ncbi:LacI family DNA-binding transcriptional regulator [Actinoallomurus iriomotensis]|uniref:LacI family transcriptional regulator n=1 Tax=Actinoallomurus iriomotensis TaxID=478107 RepID=A0A9W6S4K1_9ACTN|nr:LacI family DNA-binding transcriptional regulator [Actinoallomurus iriomotensis]GLY85270.1 LacI family transcriptional regulator [Actinoallomurus iriomotensis]